MASGTLPCECTHGKVDCKNWNLMRHYFLYPLLSSVSHPYIFEDDIYLSLQTVHHWIRLHCDTVQVYCTLSLFCCTQVT